MPRFIPYDPSQSKMAVVNYADQLQVSTFEHAIHFLIEHKLDLSIFNPAFSNNETGRPAYDPAILLKIILFAYSKGIISSREIQWSCETNIIFKALSCDTVPHFTTIANFVSGYSEEIEMLFEQVLLVCDEQGLLGKELFALEGCKMSSNAAKEWSGTIKELERKRDKIQAPIQYHITKHKALDKNEPLDDERRQRSEQAIETLTKVDKFLKQASPRPIFTPAKSPFPRLLLLHNLHSRHPGGQPVFGNIGSNKRLNRFSLRSKQKVQRQWPLYCLIHNIEKLKNYSELTL